MSSPTPFENDIIFISYAHVDNEPLTRGQEGWVSKFVYALETCFRQIHGFAPTIWRDKRDLHGNHYFENVILKELSRVAIFLPILSERYIESAWCKKELDAFCEAAKLNGGLCVADQSRIIKIEKSPVPLEKQPPQLKSLLGYPFFGHDPEKKRPRAFNPEQGSGTSSDYQDAIVDIIHSIQRLLLVRNETLTVAPQKIEAAPQASTETSAETSTETTIYLAETSYDLRSERDRIKRELQRRGHTVLPDKQFPLYAPEFKEEVKQELQRCKLSIHLIGQNYGTVPDAGQQSIVAIQNELAAERSQRDSSFLRLVWMPVGLEAKVEDERQQQFINYLQCDPDAQHGAEVLQTTLEEFKSFILEKLKPKPSEPSPPTISSGLVRIYLVCHRQDLQAVAPLEKFLFEEGYEVFLPAMEGDEELILDDHKENLLWCDAILIYYGSASEFWLRTKLRDLQKIAGYGRTTQMRAKAVYISAPETDHKQRFFTNEARVIKNYESFSKSSLNSFLDQLNSGGSMKGGQK
jgi:hypothetical protein